MNTVVRLLLCLQFVGFAFAGCLFGVGFGFGFVVYLCLGLTCLFRFGYFVVFDLGCSTVFCDAHMGCFISIFEYWWFDGCVGVLAGLLACLSICCLVLSCSVW